MESLLRWGIEHSSTGERAAVSERRDLDPAIIDHILGKPDAQLMKEALDVALDGSRDEDQRIAAMDDLEMVCSACNIERPSETDQLPDSSWRTSIMQTVRAYPFNRTWYSLPHRSTKVKDVGTPT